MRKHKDFLIKAFFVLGTLYVVVGFVLAVINEINN